MMSERARSLWLRSVFGAATAGFLVLVVTAFHLLHENEKALRQESYDVTGIASMQLRIHFEHLLGELALIDTDRPDADPAHAVLQYDILAERLTALPRQPSYENLLDAEVLRLLGAATAAIEAEAPLIEQARRGDAQALAGVRQRLEPLRTAIARIAHRPIQNASELRDAARASLAAGSAWLSAVVAMFIVVGGVFVILIWRQMKRAEAREKTLEANRDRLESHVSALEALKSRSDRQAKDALKLTEELTRARERLHDALESISEGFALWDRDDRMVMCNARYRTFYRELDDILRPGLSFVDFMTAAVSRGMFPTPEDTAEAEIAHRVTRHRTTDSSFEQPLADGRSLQINKRRTPRGDVVATLSDITAKLESERTIRRLAHEDSLTGLPNRLEFQRRLRDSLAQSQRTGRKVGVMLLDLDHFKTVNDTMGHAAGDELLRRVADRLRVCIRSTDIVSRLGGDEFGVISTNAEDAESVHNAADRIIEALAAPFMIDGREVFSGASIGITVYPDDPGDIGQLVRNADLALYRAKEDGRRACRLFDEQMHRAVQARSAVEQDLRQALARGEFQMHFQPQVDLRTGRIIGAESLIRWRHPERGLVSPAEFIPVAEKTRQIIDIGRWVIRDVCRQYAAWRAEGLTPPTIAVNVSPLQFKQQDFVATVLEPIAEFDVPAERLEIEITEGLAMEMGGSTLHNLEALKDRGVKLAIDDFGNGYSSLARLKHFPVDRLKIDQNFIRSMTEEDCDAAICSAVIQLGHALDLDVVAEGVETREQLALLSRQGCDTIQGYLVSRPMAADDFAAFSRAYAPAAFAAPGARTAASRRRGVDARPEVDTADA